MLYINLLKLLFTLLLFSINSITFGATYPDKPIRLVVPFSPGGGNDSIARVIAAKLTEKLGQQVFIDNKPGAGGTLGAHFSSKAPPDGYTLFLGGVGSLVVNPSFNKNLPYDPIKDFEPIILLANSPLILAIYPKLEINSVQQLVDYLQKNPQQLYYASNGIGSSSQLAAMMFESMAKVDMVHVPYKGLTPALNDLLSGQVQLMFSSLVAIIPMVNSQRLKAIAVTGKTRSQILPNIPTLIESGYPEYVSGSWYGLLAPAGTSREIITKINKACTEALQNSNIKEQLIQEGAEPIGGSPFDFKKHIQNELDQTTTLLKKRKILLN